MIQVRTKNAKYIVDRENNRWMRLSDFSMHEFDNEWVNGGFTLGGVGSRAYAHFERHPNEALGRWTSTVIEILDPDEGSK